MALSDLLANPRLRTRVWGYDRRAADEFLWEIEASYRALLGERDELRAQVEAAEERVVELERELVARGGEAGAVGDGLRERAEAAEERVVELEHELVARQGEASAVRDALVEAAAIRAEAEGDARRIVGDAEKRAAALFDDVKLALSKRQAQDEDSVAQTRQRLAAVLRELLDQVTNSPLGDPGDGASSLDDPPPSAGPGAGTSS